MKPVIEQIDIDFGYWCDECNREFSVILLLRNGHICTECLERLLKLSKMVDTEYAML